MLVVVLCIQNLSAAGNRRQARHSMEVARFRLMEVIYQFGNQVVYSPAGSEFGNENLH